GGRQRRRRDRGRRHAGGDRQDEAQLHRAISGASAGAARRQAQGAHGGGGVSLSPHSRGSGRFDLAVDGTFTQASPSSTSSSPTLQLQASRARSRSGMCSATVTGTSTPSPLL